MAKGNKKSQEYTTEKVLDSLNETAYKAENFFEKHAKTLMSIFGVLALIAVGYFVYLKYFLEPKLERAFTEMHQADEYFEQDSTTLALKGSPGSFQGYEQIVNEYGGTDAGNIAKYKAGVSAYKLGDYASAVSYLEDFSTSDPIMIAQKNGLIGNALLESNKLEEALPYFVKAAKATEIQLLEETYYKKAGKLAMNLGENEEALKYFEVLSNKYPNANNGEAEKYIERLKYTVSGNGK